LGLAPPPPPDFPRHHPDPDRCVYLTLQHVDYIYKIAVVGDSGVGKSAVVGRFEDDTFLPTISTFGVDIAYKTLLVRDKVVQVHVWASAGQERFRSVTS
jgi:GTPase SAR1 family protein